VTTVRERAENLLQERKPLVEKTKVRKDRALARLRRKEALGKCNTQGWRL
jgi:hypothetical protein